jgi:hypothetical protein
MKFWMTGAKSTIDWEYSKEIDRKEARDAATSGFSPLDSYNYGRFLHFTPKSPPVPLRVGVVWRTVYSAAMNCRMGSQFDAHCGYTGCGKSRKCCHSEERSDEESALCLEIKKEQIPHCPRDDGVLLLSATSIDAAV